MSKQGKLTFIFQQPNFFASSTEATDFGNGKEITSLRPGSVSAQHRPCPGRLSRSLDREKRTARNGKHKSTGTYPERSLIFMAPRMQRQSSMMTWTVPDSKFVHLMFAVMFTSTKISTRSERRPTKLKKVNGLNRFHLSASNRRKSAKPAATTCTSTSCHSLQMPPAIFWCLFCSVTLLQVRNTQKNIKDAKCRTTGSLEIGFSLNSDHETPHSPVAAELQLCGDGQLDPDSWRQRHRQLGEPNLDKVQSANKGRSWHKLKASLTTEQLYALRNLQHPHHHGHLQLEA